MTATRSIPLECAPPTVLLAEMQEAKREYILDLLRRATANGTHKEVADAIARDWFPMCCVEKNGKITFRSS